MLYACHEALRVLASYEPPDAPAVEASPREAIGYACGVLYHRYRLDADGTIADAKIVSWTIRRTGFRLQVFGQEKVLGGIETLPDTHKGWSDS